MTNQIKCTENNLTKERINKRKTERTIIHTGPCTIDDVQSVLSRLPASRRRVGRLGLVMWRRTRLVRDVTDWCRHFLGHEKVVCPSGCHRGCCDLLAGTGELWPSRPTLPRAAPYVCCATWNVTRFMLGLWGRNHVKYQMLVAVSAAQSQ